MAKSDKPDYSFLAALDQPVRLPRTSLLYLCWLVVVAGTMLVLPLIYLALVGGTGYAVYYHAVHHWTPIMGAAGLSGGRIFVVKLFIYLVPLFAGMVVVFFMFKPLLARRPKQAQPLALNAADNPVLYALISKICDTIGAPAPKRIDLDCQLNAAAGFRRGFWSMLSNDLVLVIGLPLAGTLSTREFAGVIAHEFGHFTQGAGLRLSYLIRSVNGWFARVAYERDAWDVALEEWSQEASDGRAALVVWSVQIAVWFSRLILKALLYSGHLISGFMSRQMEYDADACAIQVVGSETFETTERKIATLQAAHDLTYKQIHSVWKARHQLPDNLCELLRQAHEALPEGVRQRIDDTLGFQRTGLFDSHPSPADRIRRARQAGAPGIFHDDRPASSLFANFRYPARFVTLLHYTDDLGIPISPEMLLHVQNTDPNAGPESSTEESDAYFLGLLPLLAPLQIQVPDALIDVEAAVQELFQLSSGLEQVRAQVEPLAQQYQTASRRRSQAQAAVCLLTEGITPPASLVTLPEPTLTAAQALAAECAGTCEELRNSLREVAAAMNRRLYLALSLRLAGAGDPGDSPVTSERIQELVPRVNGAAQDYASRWRILDTLSVRDCLNTIKDSTGETPLLSKVLDAQRETITALMAKPASTTVSPASGRPALHIARHGSYINAAEIESFRAETLRWLAEYHQEVEELVVIAKTTDACSRA